MLAHRCTIFLCYLFFTCLPIVHRQCGQCGHNTWRKQIFITHLWMLHPAWQSRVLVWACLLQKWEMGTTTFKTNKLTMFKVYWSFKDLSNKFAKLEDAIAISNLKLPLTERGLILLQKDQKLRGGGKGQSNVYCCSQFWRVLLPGLPQYPSREKPQLSKKICFLSAVSPQL